MRCPICGEYGDLIRIRVKKMEQEVIVCSECDSLWENPGEELDPDSTIDISLFLSKSGLNPTWEELEILEKLPTK